MFISSRSSGTTPPPIRRSGLRITRSAGVHLPPPRLSRSPSQVSTFRDEGVEREDILPRPARRRRILSPPLPTFTTTISTPPYDTSSPDPIGLNDIPAPGSSSLPQSPTPRRIHRRSASPSHSPSRMRTVSLGRSAPMLGEPRFAHVSPPHSPSRAWLEEYGQYQARSEGGVAEPERGYLNTLWGGLADLADERPQRRRAREENGDEEERASTRRRYGLDLEERDRASRRNMDRYDELRRRREARQRDTRTDGLVFEPWSPALPSSAITAATGGSGLFGSDSHLPVPQDMPRHVMADVMADRGGPPRPISVWPTDPWDEVDSGSGEMSSYHYII